MGIKWGPWFLRGSSARLSIPEYLWSCLLRCNGWIPSFFFSWSTPGHFPTDHGQRSLMGYTVHSVAKESNTTEATQHAHISLWLNTFILLPLEGGELGHSDWSLVSTTFFYFSSLFYSQRFKSSSPPLPLLVVPMHLLPTFQVTGAENQWIEAIKKKKKKTLVMYFQNTIPIELRL